MTLNQHLAHQIRWVARNFAFNLDFVPADKWNWKPAPTAMSAQEITAHITETMHRAALMMTGAHWDEAELQMPDVPTDNSLEAAKMELHDAAEAFAAQVENLTPDAEKRVLHTPFGDSTVEQFARVDLLDLIHHHGQIAYIQTLLGDTESHFVDDNF